MARWNEGDKRGGKSKQAVARCLDWATVWVRHEFFDVAERTKTGNIMTVWLGLISRECTNFCKNRVQEGVFYKGGPA